MGWSLKRTHGKSWKAWDCSYLSTFLFFTKLNYFRRSNFDELNQVDPETAMYYSFHTDAPIPLRQSQLAPKVMELDAFSAYKELERSGHTMASQHWVSNHWGLILWKLAGLAAFNPKHECDPQRKRWCWGEVMRQMRYR